MMICELDALDEWIGKAPESRFEKLMVAVSADSKTIVKGENLPRFGTRYFHEQDRIAVPIGFRFEPHLEHQIVADALGVLEDELVIFDESKPPIRCYPIEFAKAQRSSIRRTKTLLRSSSEGQHDD